MEDNQTEQAPRRVSVIVVSFNNAAALRRTIAALEASSQRDLFEILVVDSGSADDCPRMDAEFPSVNLLRLPRNFGRVKALNIGMRTATGEFYLFLEPGMEVAGDAIPKLTAALDAAPEAAAVCPLVVDHAGQPVTRCHPLPLPAELQSAWLAGDLGGWTAPRVDEPDATELDFFKPAAVAVRSYFLRGLRYIDERYGSAWWDLEIATQIARASKKILLVRAARVTMDASSQLLDLPAGARGLLAADSALGASVWCGKHYGGWQGAKFRLLATFRLLGSVLALRDAGCRFAALQNLLTGQKLDGSQSVL